MSSWTELPRTPLRNRTVDIQCGVSLKSMRFHMLEAYCCGQLWVRHMICGQICDGLYHFAFCLVIFGIPFGFCFAGPLPLRSLSHGPLLRVHFGDSLVVRLYSEIDHIHLSSEAQCVSHHLPQVDCHTYHH